MLYYNERFLCDIMINMKETGKTMLTASFINDLAYTCTSTLLIIPNA